MQGFPLNVIIYPIAKIVYVVVNGFCFTVINYHDHRIVMIVVSSIDNLEYFFKRPVRAESEPVSLSV